MANATEDVFRVLHEAKGEALRASEIVERLEGARGQDDVSEALEHLRDEGVAIEHAEGRWSLH